MYVTSKGEKLYHYLRQEEDYSKSQAFIDLTVKEQTELVRLLKKLALMLLKIGNLFDKATKGCISSSSIVSNRWDPSVAPLKLTNEY